MDMALRTVEHSIPTDILDDLLTRFLICVPESAKENHIRICFQIELAHWFYLDFYVNNDPKLKACTIYEFAAHVFQHIPNLRKDAHKLSEILAEWKRYKQTVPTYGAILLSEGMSHVLLVQSYWAKTSWGFPKGKVNQEEDPAHCAIREVLEETGFNISNYIDREEWMETVINDQLIRLYICRNIPMSTKFQPKTRCEIKACEWFAINDLPTNKKDLTPKLKIGINPNAFFMVLPFVKKLKQLSNGNSSKRNRHKSSSVSEGEHSNVKNRNKTSQKQETEDHTKTYKTKSNRKNSHTKRQLFADEQQNQKIEFCAPSWLNFKFNRSAIIECIP